MEFQQNLVIKVKYGDSIKRLTTSVTGNNFNLDLDIAMLKKKIILTFNLCMSADFTLTYNDVDGDTVMLDDDEDLRDAAINQKLNPLRINVRLRSQLRSAAAAAAAGPKPNAGVPTRRSLLDELNWMDSSPLEVLRAPPHEMIKKPSRVAERFRKCASRTGIKELPITKMSIPVLNISQAAPSANVPSGSTSGPANGTKGNTRSASTTSSASDTTPASQKSKEPKASNMTPASQKSKEPKMVQGFNKEGFPFAKDGTKANANSCDKEWFPIAKDAKAKAASERQRIMQNSSHKGTFCAPQPGPQPHLRHASSDIPPCPIRYYPAGQSYRKEEEYKSTFQACHWGIKCDGCDEKIFVGPRYKSIMKDDHDLCAKCFASFGKPDEYIKFGFPAPSKMAINLNQNFNLQIPPRDSSLGGQKMSSKLESRLIQDVTIPKGTIMAPSTQFTKVWRMRNNGSSLWPSGTQFVWVGGYQLTAISFPLEIPVNGLSFDEDIDIAVDFCAPAREGVYISYWRLASPSGQKFGQIVWVFIRVEQPDNSKQDINSTIDLNLSSESSSHDSTDSEMTDVEDTTSDSEPSVKITTSNDRPTLDEIHVSVTEPDTNTENGPDASIPPTVSDPTLDEIQVSVTEPDTSIPPAVSDPLTDISPTSETVADPGPSVPVQDVVENNADVLLKELEEIGYMEVDLKELEQQWGEYLCEFSDSEWDPLNEDLEELIDGKPQI